LPDAEDENPEDEGYNELAEIMGITEDYEEE